MAQATKPRVNSESGRPEYAINEEADQALKKILIRYVYTAFGLLLLMTLVMSFLNIPGTPLFGMRRFLDTISILIVLTPFFIGMNKYFRTRLEFGRKFVDKKQWTEAVASLESFNHLGQHFFDSTGEAHYLLSVALAHQGRVTEAEKAREFVVKSRPSSPWAERAREAAQNKPRAASVHAKRPVAAAGQAETRPRAAKGGKRRRF